MSFYEDRDFGEAYQHKLLELIEFDEYSMAKGDFKPYDVKIVHAKETILFEVKADRKAASTKNLAIEFEYDGRPSGIQTTDAHYWAYFIVGTDKYYLIPTLEIRKAIEEKQYKYIVRGGDGFKSQMYLIPMSLFENYVDDY